MLKSQLSCLFWIIHRKLSSPSLTKILVFLKATSGSTSQSASTPYSRTPLKPSALLWQLLGAYTILFFFFFLENCKEPTTRYALHRTDCSPWMRVSFVKPLPAVPVLPCGWQQPITHNLTSNENVLMLTFWLGCWLGTLTLMWNSPLNAVPSAWIQI